MDMSSKPNIDRAIFDVLCLFTDVDTDKIAGKLTMRQFAEQVIEPMQHGKAHLRYSADGVLLWFFSWLPVNDNDLEYMKKNNCDFPDRFELLQRKTGDHVLITLSVSRPKMFMKDKAFCKDILKNVTTRNSVYAYRPVQGKTTLKKLRIL